MYIYIYIIYTIVLVWGFCAFRFIVGFVGLL